MHIGYRLIAPMIAQSNSKMAHIHHLSPSMGYQNPNLRLFTHIWMKTSLRASFNPPNHRSAPPSYLSRRRTAHYDYVWINEVLTKLQCVIVIPCPQFQHSSIDSELGVSSPKSTFGAPTI